MSRTRKAINNFYLKRLTIPASQVAWLFEASFYFRFGYESR